MWPYGQTPPLEKCEQPDLKHPQAMLQNDTCPQNSPRGGRVSPPGPRTTMSRILCGRPNIGLSPTSSPGFSQFSESLVTRLGVSPTPQNSQIYVQESFWLVYMSPKQLTALEGRKMGSRGGRR